MPDTGSKSANAPGPLSGVGNVDGQPLAGGGERLLDLIEARGVAQIEQPVDLWPLPAEPAREIGPAARRPRASPDKSGLSPR